MDLLTNQQLLQLSDPEWLIDRLIPMEARVGLYGAYGTAKSFIALDWALCIATGRPWHGHVVQQGPVIYIGAEGGGGIKKRVRAWMAANAVTEVHGIQYLLEPISVRNEQTVDEFITELQTMFPEHGEFNAEGDWEPGGLWPQLIVIDTLSASFDGGEENNSEDMGAFMNGVINIGREQETAVLVVHHSNALGSKARGHTSFGCNLDVVFKTEAKIAEGKIVGAVGLVNEKQKDDEACDTLYFQPTKVEGSLVLKLVDPPPKKDRDRGGPPKPPDMHSMRVVLRAAEDGMTWKEWKIATGLDKPLFNRRISRLMKDGEVYKKEGRYYLVGAIEDYAEDEDDRVHPT